MPKALRFGCCAAHDFLFASLYLAISYLQKLKDLKFVKVQPDDSTYVRIGKKILFLTSVGRNAIVVIVAGIIAFAVKSDTFKLTGMSETLYALYVIVAYQTYQIK